MEDQVRDCGLNSCIKYFKMPDICNYSGSEVSIVNGSKCKYGFPPQSEPQFIIDPPRTTKQKTDQEHPFNEWGKKPLPFP